MNMFDFIENFMNETGCDYETAAREWDFVSDPENYDPELYENFGRDLAL